MSADHKADKVSIKEEFESLKLNYFKSLALAREKIGRWSKIVKSKVPPKGIASVPTYEDIDFALKGSDYFKFGIKPRVEELGLKHYEKLAENLKIDIVTTIRHAFGIKISKAYGYCDILGFDLPIKYKSDDANKFESKYVSLGGKHTNDCSVRSFSRMLGISYDESLRILSESSGKNLAAEGSDSDILKKFCSQHNLTYFSDILLFGGKTFGNLTPYELYHMIPELKRENISLGVYRHMFCVNKGVAYDHKNHLHRVIDFIICPSDKEEKLKKLFRRKIKTCFDIKMIAYERWARATPWKTLAFDLRMHSDVVKLCTDTLEYKSELRKLIYGWRSKEEFIDWILDYHNIVNRLSRRFGIDEGETIDMIRIVQARHGIEKLYLN